MKNSTSTIASSDKDTIKPFLFEEESLADPRKGLFGAAFWARRGPSTNGRSDPSTARGAQSVFEFSGKRNITMQATRALLLAPLVLAITVTTASNVNAGSAVVTDGKFTNIYVYRRNSDKETWEQHMAKLRPMDAAKNLSENA